MEQYNAQIKIIEDGHRRERSNLTQQLKEVMTDMRALKITNSRLRRTNEACMKNEADLRKELEAVQDANKNLHQRYDADFKRLESTLLKEKRILSKRNMELRSTVRAMKIANNKLRTRLECQVKHYEEEIQILRAKNEAMSQELEALKTRVPMKNLELFSTRSGPQGQTQAKFSIDSFHPIRILGEGGFGKVLLAKKRASDGLDERFALKVVKKAHLIACGNASFTIVEKEAMILASGHPFISTLYSCFQTKEHTFFVMEYASGGNLANELERVQVFSEEIVRFYAAEITLALEFLHRQAYLLEHICCIRDLKLENVLINGDGHCRVADFGLSQLGIFQGRKTDIVCGTPCYMAPEMLKQLPYDHSVDWWSLGIIMYTMLDGRLPFTGRDKYQLYQQITGEDVNFPTWVSEDAEMIISQETWAPKF